MRPNRGMWDMHRYDGWPSGVVLPSPSSRCKDKKIVTVEGLSAGEKLDRIQEAFIAARRFSMRFLHPGMIMTAKAFSG